MPSGVIAESYRQDVAFHRGAWARVGVLAVALAAVVAPFVLTKSWQAVGVLRH